jgi:D-lactate dehydrogenase
MGRVNRRRDYRALPERHRLFWDQVSQFLPESSMACDPLRTLAYGTDASFYRLIPKIVIQARTREELSRILRAAAQFSVPVTFRAAGTSLSGQAQTDSVLLTLSGGWRAHQILDGGERIALEPGIIGAEANALLAPYGRKIGPDPASIGSCMIGGIAANNASGMCCGTAQNSYQTADGMRLIFWDGSVLDTSDPQSRLRFGIEHRDIVDGIAAIRDEIAGDEQLARRIREKYRIKNTTGYGLNSFIDFHDPIDILLHLMIGSEGTLAFIAEITYRTVPDHSHKASALVVFPDIANAARATQRLKGGPVAAVEMMDRASLRSVENKEGLPAYLKTLEADACALLIETRAADPDSLTAQATIARELLAEIPKVFPVEFTSQKAEFEKLWNVRRGLFPAVGASRRIGTTVVIEDVAFPMQHLADATVELQQLFRRHGYPEGIIFGHALDGNLHFVFTQDFGTPQEVLRYERFMNEVCEMVAKKYDGSLKGEHGTGRNMAPFVELEWGKKAYGLMKTIKALFDPRGLLNPGVVINENPRAHLEHFKPLPSTHELVDKCIECGFCEVKCPSREITLTPRQRIVIRREIARLRSSGETAARLRRLERDYRYWGDQTCATDGLCATACPVSIDTGQYTKYLRELSHSSLAIGTAREIAGHYAGAQVGLRAGLFGLSAVHEALGTKAMERLAKGARALSGDRLPLWNSCMPSAAPPMVPTNGAASGSELQVVYFPSCIARTMGPAKRDPDQRAVFQGMLSILAKAGYGVRFPRSLDSLCCGMPFESKGFREPADAKVKELQSELWAQSDEGRIPVLCDTSPCVYRMRAAIASRPSIYEPVEFIHRFLLDHLHFERQPETVALHVTCSSLKMGLAQKMEAIAQACAERVVVPPGVGCCGFAGDKGFTHPELNASALSRLRSALPSACSAGYSNSRTCEIGLSLHSGIPYQSIVSLVDRCSRPGNST